MWVNIPYMDPMNPMGMISIVDCFLISMCFHFGFWWFCNSGIPKVPKAQHPKDPKTDFSPCNKTIHNNLQAPRVAMFLVVYGCIPQHVLVRMMLELLGLRSPLRYSFISYQDGKLVPVDMF